MGLTQDNIVDFANVIAGTTGSTASMNVAFDEVMQSLARSPNPPLVQSSAFAISSGTANYTWSADAVRILAVFNEGLQLHPSNAPELESYSAAWRASSTDAPLVYHAGENTLRSARLFPSPSTGSTGTWLHSIAPQSDIPEYMSLYIAFAVLEREFAYPSAHQDKEFSGLCGQIANIFGKLIGFVP